MNPRARTNKCIALDLDETILYTCEELDDFARLGIYDHPDYCDLRRRVYVRSIEGLGAKRGDGTVIRMCGILRPHTHEFLRFCFDYFMVVAVWTAGLTEYGMEMVDWAFRDIADPHILYTRPSCERHNGNLEKPLTKMFNAELPGIMSLKNTFILDDNTYSFEHANPDNGILIPHFRPLEGNNLLQDDPSLLELMAWLERPEVMNAPDVRLLDKKNIFSGFPSRSEDREDDE